ncbi:hypothetical protein [Brucella tritici]|jgi:hypothetical protein|uniref:hypothetical protein n=1 Tax=Brucella tritici TaxID=94626 RepID=UPI003D6C8C20
MLQYSVYNIDFIEENLITFSCVDEHSRKCGLNRTACHRQRQAALLRCRKAGDHAVGNGMKKLPSLLSIKTDKVGVALPRKSGEVLMS